MRIGARPDDRTAPSPGTDSAESYTCEAFVAFEGVLRLETEWETLWKEASDSRVGESFAWMRLCWSHPVNGHSRRPFFLAVRQGRRLVAVWPLAVSREAAWRIAAPLISSTEYCPFLVHPDADADQVWSAMAGVLRRAPLDALRLLNVRRDGRLGGCLERDGAPKTELYATTANSLDRTELADWSCYRARLSGGTRQTISRHRRRLSAAGELVFEDVTDPTERAATWRWMLAEKRRWARHKGAANGWLASDGYDRFVAASLQGLGSSGARRVFALKLDGAPVAAVLASVDRTRVEGFMTVYDPAFAEFSPGTLAHEDSLRWASENGLGYDMRLGEGAHKDIWRATVSEVASYVLPLNLRGRLFATCLRLAASSGRRRETRAFA